MIRAACALTVLALLWACVPREPPAPRLTLAPSNFGALPGWSEDHHGAALAAFLRSCAKLDGRAATETIGGALPGQLAVWQDVCRVARAIESPNDESARKYFETYFRPYTAGNHGEVDGLFTGYFEPELNGSLQPSTRYSVPLYARPADLVTVELGRFREEFKGERIAGRVENGALVPYHTRAEIDGGALDGQGQVLVWVDDPVDVFFLHIQGSGRIRFADGSARRIAYAAANGQPYHAIGRSLVERGEIEAVKLSMQTIRAWLHNHPAEAPTLMQQNRSFVFFRWLDGDDARLGPVGAQGVPLTAGRSLAIDVRFIPFSVPIWLDTTAPAQDPAKPDQTLRRLVVAQDAGSAIEGPVRGDLFWGSGEAAGEIAGRMKQHGRYWLLLPRNLDASALVD